MKFTNQQRKQPVQESRVFLGAPGHGIRATVAGQAPEVSAWKKHSYIVIFLHRSAGTRVHNISPPAILEIVFPVCISDSEEIHVTETT